MGKHYEQLTAEERSAIMLMKVNNCSARQIALALHRAPLTITREPQRSVSHESTRSRQKPTTQASGQNAPIRIHNPRPTAVPTHDP